MAVVVRLLLDRYMEERFLFAPFLIAILVASRYGLGPSLMATVSSLLSADYLFYPPRYSIAVGNRMDQLGLAFNACASLVIVLLAEFWRWRDAARLLRRKTQQLTRELADSRHSEEIVQHSERMIRTVLDSIHDAVIIHDGQGRILDVNGQMLATFGVSREEAMDLSIARDLSREAYSLEERMALWSRVIAGETLLVEWRLWRPRDGSEFPAEVFLRRIHLDGRDVVMANVRNIAERKQAEREQQRAMERVGLLSDVASRLLASDRPQDVVQSLCERVLRHLDCEVFLNFLVESGQDRLHLNAYGGIAPETARELEWLDYGADGCGWVAQLGQPLIINDVPHSADPRAELVHTLGGTAYACHPLVNQDQMIGTLSFVSQTRMSFSEDEVTLMQTVADHVAIAVQRKQLLESVEQRAAEAEEGRQVLEALMEHIPMAITIAESREGKVRMVSRYGRELTGAVEPFEGAPIEQLAAQHQVFHSDGVTPASREECPLARAMQKGELVREQELILRREDGRAIPMLCNAAPIRDAQGRITGGVVGCHDITQRKLAEQALYAAREQLEVKVKKRTEQLARANAELEAQVVERRRAELNLRQRNELLQAIVDNIPVMLMLHDAEGRFRFVNKEFEHLVGWTIEEVSRLDLVEALLPEPEPRRQSREFMNTADTGWHDFLIHTRWGGALETAWANIRLSDGARIGIGIDISDRKRAHVQLETLNRTLEQRADQLQAMAMELTQSEERERRRLAQVLHDHLQQLLVAARMKVALLRRRIQDERQGRAVEQVDELLNQCITESRSLTVELSPPVLYDAGLGAGLAWLARQTEEKHGLEVHLQADPDIEPADQGTKILLFQAVRELLFNVVKHAQAVHADVEVTREENLIRVEVRDNGVGFEPGRVNHHAGGRGGFGLFSIRERLELIGGRFEVDSAPGRGSRMVIVAPLEPIRPASAEAAVIEGPATAEPHVPVSSDRSEGKTIRVLLADDHPILRKGLADLLDEHPGIDVVGEASNGEEVVDLARRTQPDVVVMDVTMPRLSGVEATRRIVTEQPQVRVIGLSMHEQSDMVTAMRDAGAVAYLCKSHPTDALVAMILQPSQAVMDA